VASTAAQSPTATPSTPAACSSALAPAHDREKCRPLAALNAPVGSFLADLFGTLSPQLRRLRGKEAYAAVRHDVDNLQFKDAARALDGWSAAAASAAAAASVPAIVARHADAG
jgi:hypothetical protein